ncbi:MBL fold metallo-hydrolase [bacterium SCSIO 12696]|nr:MBL fold metallo-hydrolase [bacterium SCSIO 12696]
MMIKRTAALSVLLTVSLAAVSLVAEARKPAKIEQITDHITVLKAGGGNITLFSGSDGLFVADTGAAHSRDRMLNAVKSVSDQPVRFVVNTHWHFDHVGNNDGLHTPKHNHHAVVIAHENVRKRMAAGQYIPGLDRTTGPAPEDALPVITYTSGSDSAPTIVHFNGEKVQVFAVDPAHTDGDSFVFWPTSNVIHSGDLFFNGIWPLIDDSSGGNIDGVISAAQKMLALSDNNTQIVPGHGPVASKADLQHYLNMLNAVAQRVKAAKAQNKTLKGWLAENPLQDMEEEWGDGFLSTVRFIGAVWRGL